MRKLTSHKRTKQAGILMLALWMSACGAQGTLPSDTIGETADVSGAAAVTQTPEDPTPETASGEHHLLYAPGFGNQIYVVDDNGKQLAQYDLQQIEDTLTQQGYNGQDMWLRTADVDQLYFTEYKWNGSNGKYTLYAVQPDPWKVQAIWASSEDWSLDTIDLYQDQVCIRGSIHNTDYSSVSDRETVLRIQPNADNTSVSYVPKKDDLADFWQAAAGYRLIAKSTLYNTASDYGYTRVLDQYGFVLASTDSADKRFVRIAADGTISSLPKFYTEGDNDPSVYGYDDRYILYGVFDAEAMHYHFSCLEIASGRIEQIADDDSDLSFLDYQDGVAYFSDDVTEEYGLTRQDVYEYNCAEQTLRKLYAAQSIPGAGDLVAGTSGFRIIHGKLYALTLEGDTEEWVVRDPAAADTYTRTGFALNTINTFHYGQVQYTSDTELCPFCQTPLEKNYNEYFVLDARYSAYADQINAALRDGLDASDTAEETYDAPEYTDEYCEDHLAYPTQWCETVDNYIGDVKIFSDQYLIIDRNGYWYGGGVHGYPLRNQIVFDLTTGERKTFKDFYTGSEEDFKTLVAQKTREDYESYPPSDYPPYFAGSAEDVYNDAYEYANLENTSVEFVEDGVLIVYPPYDMGPYASGYIQILISYQDVFGRDRL